MPDEGPPPIVPTMRTDATSDPDVDPVLTDGGSDESPEAPADRPFGAPLVPDCS